MIKYLIAFLLFAQVSFAGGVMFDAGGVEATGSITIAYVSMSTASGGLTTVGTLPTGTLDGDIMIASINSDSASTTITPPAGWTQINTIIEGSSTLQYSFYKVASSESGTYTFNSTFADPTLLHISTFSKSSGTWIAPTGANLNSTSSSTIATITTGSVTIPTGSMLFCSYGNDGVRAVTTPPPGMTAILEEVTGDLSMATYYQSGLSGATTKDLVWNAVDQSTSVSNVLGAE